MSARDWLMPVLTGSLGMAAFFAIKLAPGDDASQIAVLLPPWQSAQEALRTISATGAAIVREGGMPVLWVVDAPPGSSARAALDEVAWIVMDPGLLGICAAISDWSRRS